MAKLDIFLFFWGIFYTVVLVAHAGIAMFVKRVMIWHVAVISICIIAVIISSIGVILEINSTPVTSAIGIVQMPLIIYAASAVYFYKKDSSAEENKMDNDNSSDTKKEDISIDQR